ncbi:DUF4242 domain-containing protein [Ferruginibacter sp.]
MKRFVIERNLPGAGNLTAAELQEIAVGSCAAIKKMDNYYQWVETFVTGDKLYCIHIAESEADVREHAKLGNFPVNSINEVKAVIDPLTSVKA